MNINGISHDESFEVEGVWTLEEKLLPGTLAYDSQKKQLSLCVKSYTSCTKSLPRSNETRHLLKTKNLIQGKVMWYRVYLFHCSMIKAQAGTTYQDITFRCSMLLIETGTEKEIEREPLIEEKTPSDTSWENIRLTRACVEYKNLPKWKRESSPAWREELPKPTKETIANTTITYTSLSNRKWYPLENQNGIIIQSYISFDFRREKEGKALNDIFEYITFFERLLHFAMTPEWTTYVLSMILYDKRGRSYQCLYPTIFSPIKEGVFHRSPFSQTFIPSRCLNNICECFDKYKDIDRIRLLFHLFTRPSHIIGRSNSDIDTMYLYAFISLECIARIEELSKKIENYTPKSYTPNNDKEAIKSDGKKILAFLIENLPEEIRKGVKESSSNLGEKLETSEFITEMNRIRCDFVHANTDKKVRTSSEKMDKIRVIYVCLIYQIQKEIFKLSPKEIMSVGKSILTYPYGVSVHS